MEDVEKSTLIVKDANIVIDLVNAGLLATWFELSLQTITTDFVESELKRGSQWGDVEPLVKSGQLKVIGFSEAEVTEIFSMSVRCGVSLADGSVLFLSQKTEARLLTGDRKLRKAAEREAVEVAGILWILDHMVSKGALSGSIASQSLRDMIKEGARLPMREVEKRLLLWGAES